MRKAAVCSLLSALAFAGCDRSFPARVSGRLVLGTAPLVGTVIPLGADVSTGLDATGHFDLRYERLNVSPFSMPLLIVPRSGRPFVLQPQRDFTLTKKGGEWVGTIDLDATRAKPVRPIAVNCVGVDCTASLPPQAATCMKEVLAMTSTGVTSVPRRETFGATGTEIVFRAGPDPLVLVAACGPSLDDYVSDVVVGPATADAGGP